MATCASCGADIPEGFNFCGRCGAPLSSAPDLEERRVVTVLFCDLVGFTARFDHADPEDVRGLLRPYHAGLRHEIERFGGTLDKFIGDGVMAVFGAPTAHEDDPERAVRSALAILDAVEKLNQALPDLDLQVRIGINTGETVVAADRQSEAVVGDAVNTASRLESVAPVGGIVVGEPTWRVTRRLFDYEPLPPVKVKGKADPLPIWRAIRARGRVGVNGDTEVATPFVGRDLELRLLQDVFRRVVNGVTVQLVTVVGEPGVGKTRLVREFRGFVDARPELVRWRQGRCLPYGDGITFWALGEIVKGQAGVLESDDPTVAAGKLGDAVAAVVEDDSEREWLTSRLAPLIGLMAAEGGVPVEREEAFTAWRRFLEAVAVKSPLVIVVEDLHWADGALIAFVQHLIEWATGVPLLVVATARPELYDHVRAWGGGLRNQTTISLPPLSDADTAQLFAALLDQAILTSKTQAALLQRVEGNPLYAEQICRLIADEAILERPGGTMRLPPGAEAAFPASLQALIAARLDALAQELKALLYDAAVIGTVFWSGALCAMGDRDATTVQAGLHELARREFVRPARTSSVKGEAEYAFWHVLTRDGAYARLPRGARISKHQAAAAWIEQVAGERVSDQAEVLAYHYGEAQKFAQAAAMTADAAGLEAKARRFLVLAGDRAMALDGARAYDHYERALQLYSSNDPPPADVIVKLATAAYQQGRLSEAERLYEQATARFQARREVLSAGETMVGHARVVRKLGDTARASGLVTAAVELLGPAPSRELALAYTQKAAYTIMSGRLSEGLEWASKAITMTELLGADDIRHWALQYRGLARFDFGDLDGLQDLRKAVELALKAGVPQDIPHAYSNLAVKLYLVEGPAAAMEVTQLALTFCDQRGMVETAMVLKGDVVEALIDLGRWEEAMRINQELLAWYRSTGGIYFRVPAECHKAYILLYKGDAAEAARLAEEFLPQARRIQDPQILLEALAIATGAAQACGDAGTAIRFAEEFQRLAGRDPAPPPMKALLELIRACVAIGEPLLAEQLLEGIEAYAPSDQHCQVAAQAMVAEALGRLEQASSFYADAAERWSKFGEIFRHAQALLGLGRCQAELGHRSAAERLLEAREIFARLDAQPLLADSNRWLQQIANHDRD